MKQRPAGRPSSSEQIIRGIKRKTRKQYNAEEKIRIVLDGLRGEDSIAELCRRYGIAQDKYYKWSKTLWKPARSARLAIPRLIIPVKLGSHPKSTQITEALVIYGGIPLASCLQVIWQ